MLPTFLEGILENARSHSPIVPLSELDFLLFFEPLPESSADMALLSPGTGEKDRGMENSKK
jgi:hypothetical protein